jgi:membrane-bound lytic murein transglycosylase B
MDCILSAAWFFAAASVIMAIWTLETDNGTADMGKMSVVRTIATLAHDCRRTNFSSAN